MLRSRELIKTPSSSRHSAGRTACIVGSRLTLLCTVEILMEIKPLTTNCFSIKDADLYECAIYHYTVSHAIMTIVATHPITEESFYLELLYTMHFSGPVHWKGVGFNTSSMTEAL